MELPSNYANLLDIHADDPNRTSALLLWDIPRDGDVYQHIISRCLGLTAAGGALGDKRQTDVEIYKVS